MQQVASFAESSYDGDTEKSRRLEDDDDRSTCSKEEAATAIQQARLQASFAEQTVAEMQAILETYENGKEPREIPLTVFPYDEEEDDQVEEEEDRDNTRTKQSFQTPSPKQSRQRLGLPPLAFSPDSPLIESSDTDSKKEAAAQLEQVKHVIHSTEHMAAIVSEYERSSSSSGSETKGIVPSYPRKRRTRTEQRKKNLGLTWILAWVVLPLISSVLVYQVLNRPNAIILPQLHQEPVFEVSESRIVTRCQYRNGGSFCEKEEHIITRRGP